MYVIDAPLTKITIGMCHYKHLTCTNGFVSQPKPKINYYYYARFYSINLTFMYNLWTSLMYIAVSVIILSRFFFLVFIYQQPLTDYTTSTKSLLFCVGLKKKIIRHYIFLLFLLFAGLKICHSWHSNLILINIHFMNFCISVHHDIFCTIPFCDYLLFSVFFSLILGEKMNIKALEFSFKWKR